MGAVIVVLSLAFDTFAQQVLGSRVRDVISSGPSTSTALPRSSAYQYVYTGSDHTVTALPLAVQGALLASVFTSNISVPQGVCSTGNCTWPTTPSLGVCSSCSDVKKSLKKKTVTIEISNVTHPAVMYSVSDSNTITWPKSSPINFDANMSVIYPTYNPYPTDRIQIANFSMLGVPPSKTSQLLGVYGSLDGGALQPEVLDALIVAYDCSIYFCLQAYEAQTISGVPHQSISSTWHQYTETSEGDADGDPSFNSLAYNFTNVPKSMNIRNASEYIVEETSRMLLAASLATELFANATLSFDELIPQFCGSTGGCGYGAPSGQSPTAEAFLNATDTLETISAQVKHVADGLTSYMRSNIPATNNNNDDSYAPTVHGEKTFIHVRWPWLTYPLALLVTGHIFLFVTIWHTKRLRVRPWKSHRIPYLLATIDDDIRRLAAGGLDDKTGLEKRLGEAKVHLYYDNMYELAFRKSP